MRREQRAVRGVFLCGVLFLFLIAIASISRLEALTIGEVSVSGTETADGAAIAKLAEERLEGSYWLLVPRRSVFAYPKAAIAESIRAAYTQIATTSLSARPGVLRITVAEHHPAFVWCRVPDSTECYYMTATGYIYAPAPHFSGGAVYLSWFGGIAGEPVGTQFGSTTDAFGKIVRVIRELPRVMNDTVMNVEAMGSGDYRIGMRSAADVIMHEEDDSDAILERLSLALSAPAFKEKRADSSLRLEYIDLRFGKKVFYTFTSREKAN